MHAFAVLDEEDTLTSLTAFEAKERAESSSKRPSSSGVLSPDASVQELEGGVGSAAKEARGLSRKATGKRAPRTTKRG
jgi:hypothetical protein